jgi:hypothetical protein
MFEGWGDYFFMIGSSAAALIGLAFVVITLTAGRERDETERGKKLYTSPIVWHLSVILLLSGAAIVPAMIPRLYGAASGGLGILGFLMGCRSAAGIAKFRSSSNKVFDATWYGVAPAIAYLGLVVGALAVLTGHRWAAATIAGDLMALLLISIHAEWDLVTYLAPLAGPGDRG